MGRGQVQSPQARMSRTQGRVYAVMLEAGHADQPDLQGTFYTCNYFFCIIFIIVAPCVIDLGLEVEAFREMMGNSSLGCRVRVGQMCRDRELGILVILFMVDFRVVDVLGVDVIFDMDELRTIGVVSNWDLSRVVILDTVLEFGEVTYARSWMRMCVEFRDKILFKEGRM